LPENEEVDQEEKVRLGPPFTAMAKYAPPGASTLVLPRLSIGGLAEVPKVVIELGSPFTATSTTFPCIENDAGNDDVAFVTSGVYGRGTLSSFAPRREFSQCTRGRESWPSGIGGEFETERRRKSGS
jgi:hypothetical protein